MAENREYFISCLQLLKSELSDENYKKITGVMKALKYGLDFDYKPGYDIDFEYDIDTIKEKKRINNVVKLKLVNKK